MQSTSAQSSGASIPFGWGNRKNGAIVEQAELPPQKADWLYENMAHKYPLEDIKSENGVPALWGNRKNATTLEDMTMAKTAHEIAIGEIHLKADANDLLYTKKYSAYPRLDNIEEKIKKDKQKDNVEEIQPKPISGVSGDILTLILNKLTDIDTKINEMGSKLDLLDNRTTLLAQIVGQAMSNASTAPK